MFMMGFFKPGCRADGTMGATESDDGRSGVISDSCSKSSRVFSSSKVRRRLYHGVVKLHTPFRIFPSMEVLRHDC